MKDQDTMSFTIKDSNREPLTHAEQIGRVAMSIYDLSEAIRRAGECVGLGLLVLSLATCVGAR